MRSTLGATRLTHSPIPSMGAGIVGLHLLRIAGLEIFSARGLDVEEGVVAAARDALLRATSPAVGLDAVGGAAEVLETVGCRHVGWCVRL
jgi:hypothetical protein